MWVLSNAYKLEIEGYTLDIKKLPDNATGTLSVTAQTVTYVYTKNKVNPVKPTSSANKASHKEDIHKSVPSSLLTHDKLPETGENERMTLMSVGTGLVLLMVVLITFIFRFKRIKSNK